MRRRQPALIKGRRQAATRRQGNGLVYLEVGFEVESMSTTALVCGRHDAGLLIVADALFEEVGLSLQ